MQRRSARRLSRKRQSIIADMVINVDADFDSLKGISGYADSTQSGNEAFVRIRNNEEVSPIAQVLVKSYFGKWEK